MKYSESNSMYRPMTDDGERYDAPTAAPKSNVIYKVLTILFLVAALVVVLVVFVSAHSEEDTPTPLPDTPTELFEFPWDVQYGPNGDMFLTERCKGLSVLTVDGDRKLLFGIGSGALLTADDMFCQGQSGVNGVALDPSFGDASSPNGRDVYVFFASNLAQPRTNRVSRITLGASNTDPPVGREDIVTDMSFKEATHTGGPGAHSGGRIRFGNPGTVYADYLFITQGDNHKGTLPQDNEATLPGSNILAVDRTGAAMPSNIIGSAGGPAGDPRIFAYGVRNVQGIDFRPGTDQIFIAEHGPNGYDDEVTKLVNGGNGGWDPNPVNRPGLNCPGDYCGYAGNATSMPMTDTILYPGAMLPVWDNNGLSQGMTPCVFLRGSQWGEYEGWLAVGYLSGQKIVLLKLTEDGKLASIRYPQRLVSLRYRSITNAPAHRGGGITVSIDAEQGEIFDISVETLLNFDPIDPDSPDPDVPCVTLPPFHPVVTGCVC